MPKYSYIAGALIAVLCGAAAFILENLVGGAWEAMPRGLVAGLAVTGAGFFFLALTWAVGELEQQPASWGREYLTSIVTTLAQREGGVTPPLFNQEARRIAAKMSAATGLEVIAPHQPPPQAAIRQPGEPLRPEDRTW